MTNHSANEVPPKDESLCRYPPCTELWTLEHYKMCDWHSSMMEFNAWCFDHFTYNGQSAAGILTKVTELFAQLAQMPREELEEARPVVFGPNGQPL